MISAFSLEFVFLELPNPREELRVSYRHDDPKLRTPATSHAMLGYRSRVNARAHACNE